MVSMQSTTIFGFPPIATTRSVDSGQHWEYTLICAPVLCGITVKNFNNHIVPVVLM